MKKALVPILALVLAGCGYRLVPSELIPEAGWVRGLRPGMHGGTAWGQGSFDSNGEQIFFTGANEDGERIAHAGGPAGGMMMGGYLSCASCHGPDGRGGRHMMHMDVMEAPDIRWSTLISEGEVHSEGEEHAHEADYDLGAFRRAVVEGRHPDGEPLSQEMPRWSMGEGDLRDLMEFLMELP